MNNMAKALYFECSSGVSGDMLVASLLDLGANKDLVFRAIESLKIPDLDIKIEYVDKKGVGACNFCVISKQENYDHDMEYLHGNKKVKFHHGEERNLDDILKIIDSAEMTQTAKILAKKIFKIVADAESKVHNKPIDKVHFHEVGAIDSIVDIISFSVCFDNLGLKDVCVSPLSEGKGFVNTRHGKLPIPVPAVLEIINEYSLEVLFTNIEGELITPTGAAIIAAIKSSHVVPTAIIRRKGIGAGKRDYDCPGVVRALEIDFDTNETDIVMKLESNIDDSTGECLGYTMEKLFALGAKDVFFTPVFMKKNRPSFMLTVICSPDETEIMEDLIFQETSTIGIRRCLMYRTAIGREMIDVFTKYGNIKVKKVSHKGNSKYYPEYESVKEIALKNNVPFMKIFSEAIDEAHKK